MTAEKYIQDKNASKFFIYVNGKIQKMKAFIERDPSRKLFETQIHKLLEMLIKHKTNY